MFLKNLFAAMLIPLISFAIQAAPADTRDEKKQQTLQKIKVTQVLCQQVGPDLQHIPKKMRTQEICQNILDGQKKYPPAIAYVRAGHLSVIVPAGAQNSWKIQLEGAPSMVVIAEDLDYHKFAMGSTMVIFQIKETAALVRDAGKGSHIIPNAQSAKLD